MGKHRPTSTAVVTAAVGLVSAATLTAVAPAPAGGAPARAPHGISSEVRGSWCELGDPQGSLGAALEMSERGKRGVTRMRLRWTASEVDSGAVVERRTKQSKRFANTRATHRYRARHSFTLDPGTYELRVRMTWVRDGKNWHRSVAGTCDLTTPTGSPDEPPPDLPPNLPPPPGVAEAPAPRVPATERAVLSSYGQTSCQAGSISALAPGAQTDRDEYVWWISEVWWWDAATQSWYVDSQSDYAYAKAINGSITSAGSVMGMPVWRGHPNHDTVSQRTHSGMAPGYYYTAVNWFYTDSGGWAGYYTDHGGGAWYCYVG